MVPERAIRDALAANLGVIEPGLRLVETNYHLPNSEGARGFVDILARDRHRAFVVIEVKRSDATAREAIHEVLKYCELLRLERGLRADQVRAMVVSTSWQELLVPWSELSRRSAYPVEGVQIDLGTDFPNSISASPVVPRPVPDERDLSSVAVQLDVRDEGEVTALWPMIVDRLTTAGVDDVLGIVAASSVRTILHVALGTVVPEDSRCLPPDEDVDYEAPEGEEAEYRAAGLIVAVLQKGHVVTSDRLIRIMQSNELGLIGVLRAGRFADQADLINDDESLALADGSAGGSQVMTTVSARPSHGLAWRHMKGQLSTALLGNPRWAEVLNLWLDEVEGEHPNADVVVHVYNPCDLVKSLVHGWGRGVERLLPELRGALDGAGDDARLLHGCLVWNGNEVDFLGAVRAVYQRPSAWGLASAVGEAWVTDLELLEMLELSYVIFEFPPDDVGPPRLLRVADDALHRIDPGPGRFEWPGFRPFPEFLSAVEDELTFLVEEYRSVMVPVNGGDQWLVVD